MWQEVFRLSWSTWSPAGSRGRSPECGNGRQAGLGLQVRSRSLRLGAILVSWLIPCPCRDVKTGSRTSEVASPVLQLGLLLPQSDRTPSLERQNWLQDPQPSPRPSEPQVSRLQWAPMMSAHGILERI